MGKKVVAALFCEDSAHEELLKPLVLRVGREENADTLVRVRAARGGHPRALKEFHLYQRTALRMEGPVADVLIVAIDGNCSSFGTARKRVVDATRMANRDRLVVASPDSHIERWYLPDPKAVVAVTRHDPGSLRGKCERHYYKNKLRETIRAGGNPPTLGGLEIAEDLVSEMDLYRAGKNDSSLGAFVDDLRTKYRQASSG